MDINNEVLAKFQMIGSRIVSFSMKNDSISSEIIQRGKKKLDVSHEIISIENHESKSLIGVVQLHVSVRVSLDKARFTVKLILEGGFGAPDEMGRELFEKMLSLNGIASLYGIARAQISAVTSLSFADGGIILPMIDVTKYSKNLAEKNNKTTINN